MYYIFTVAGKEYKLRLDTRAIVQLEKKIGCNPVMIFGANGDRIPTIFEMVTILWASLQSFNHSITIDDTYKIFDQFLADGNMPTDFIKEIVEIYKVSGIIKNTDTEEGTEKN